MKENKTLRPHVIDALKPYSAFAVENRAHDGTPDVCSTLGYVECKQVENWPARNTSRVGIDLRRSQQLWLKRWTFCKGRAVVLTVIAGEWFIHGGRWSAEYMATATESQIRENALSHWPEKPTRKQLRTELEIHLAKQ